MPRVADTKAETTAPSPEYELTQELIVHFMNEWKAKHAEHSKQPITYSRMSVVAMTQIAAIVGVDVGMTEEQFVAVCRANFQQAFKQAPRWG